jgi:hypothetical protein
MAAPIIPKITPANTKRPRRVSFAIEPRIYDAIAALRSAGQLPTSANNNNGLYNSLLRRVLEQWLQENEDPPRPWANIVRWLEKHPEAEKVSDRMFDAYSVEEEALRDWGEETSVTDDDGRTIDFHTVTRVQADNLAAREVEELAEIAETHRVITELLFPAFRSQRDG